MDLKLHGDKIKLESRCVSRESTASSKTSYLLRGPSRPVSAVPHLALYDDKEYAEVGFRSRRPYSADNFRSKSKGSGGGGDLQSIEELDKDLPSTELLKTLISEPIVSWRNGLARRSNDLNHNTGDAYKSDEENSSSSEDTLPGEKCQLKPGVASKPPLPKKIATKDVRFERTGDLLEGNTIEDNASFLRCENMDAEDEENCVNDGSKRCENSFGRYKLPDNREHISPGENIDSYVLERCFENVDEIEALRCSRNASRPNSRRGVKPRNSRQPEVTDYTAELEEISSALAQIGHPKETNPPDLIAESLQKISSEEVRYQNWVDDSQAERAEQQTNLHFRQAKENRDRLMLIEETQKIEDEEMKKMVDQNEIGQITEITNTDFDGEVLKRTNAITFERFFGENVQGEKIITLVDRPLEKPKPKLPMKQAKRKPDPKTNVKKPLIKNEPLKPKFVAKSMRCVKDYAEKNAMVQEEVSWMSRPERINKDSREECRPNVKMDTKGNVCPNKGKEEVVEEDCDDIAAILEVLEAESKKSQSSIQSMKNIMSTELNATINSNPSSGSSTFASEKGEAQNIDEKAHNNRNNNNFREILYFLDEVEKNSSQSLTNAKERIAISNQLIEGSMRLDTIPKQEDLQGHTQKDLSDQIVELHLRLKEKSSAIRLLQEELSSLREQVIKITKTTERSVREKLKAQKEEAEATVKRHQKFIDQLIAEKAALGRQCEGLVKDMRGMEERFEANAKAAEHRHRVELQKVKEMQAAGEKMRRERWLDSKTQKIKEMTVKSIEPEIQSMTVRHEQELADLRSLHKREIEDIDLRNARKTQQQCESLRSQLTEEREKALAHEREVMRIRYESLIESEEKSYKDQRKRLLQEHGHRMNECESREKAAAAETERAVKMVHDEYEDKIQAVVRRHTNEIKMLKESTELNLETWKNNWKKQQTAHLAAKEAAIMEQCRKERDREIEMVIERLEAEANETKVQTESATENRIRRHREKYEKEINDLECSEKEAKAKYVEARGKLLEAEETVVDLKANVRHLEMQLKEAQEISTRLQEQSCTLRQTIAEEKGHEMSKLESEIERLKKERETELQQVYARVKVAVARKDETLMELGRDYVALKEKCAYLESMLEQQRKEYLIK